MAYISYEKYGPEYQKLWDTMRIIRDAAELHRVSEKIKKYQDVYKKAVEGTKIPWQFIAVIHLREAGESDIGKWKGVLHNGEKIVGTGRKTTLVPKGRGPFATWEAAVKDAIRIKGFDKIVDWPIARVLWALEPYNGYGYRNKGLRSPYLWASTNHQQPGKYVSDGVFNPNVVDSQIGCAALLKFLEIGKATAVPPVVGPVIAGGGAVAAIETGKWWIFVAACAAGLIAWFLAHWFKRKTANVS